MTKPVLRIISHLWFLLLPALTACTAHSPDYTLLQRHLPRSIVVLPPLNTTTSVDATNRFLSTISEPLAERGYYVVPIAVADAMLRENGVVSPVEARQVSRQKLQEIFGADAVLDITIESWGTQYLLIASQTTVTMLYRLIDLRTGDLLWSTTKSAVDQDNNRGGLASQMVGALIHATANSLSHPEGRLARQANNEAVGNGYDGLLDGPRIPKDGQVPQ